jgi:hypothetical protein
VLEAKVQHAEISRDTFMLKNAQLAEKNQAQFEEIQELKARLRESSHKPAESVPFSAHTWRPVQP